LTENYLRQFIRLIEFKDQTCNTMSITFNFSHEKTVLVYSAIVLKSLKIVFKMVLNIRTDYEYIVLRIKFLQTMKEISHFSVIDKLSIIDKSEIYRYCFHSL